MRRVGWLLLGVLLLSTRGRADEDEPRADPYAGWGPKLDAVLAQVPQGPGDAGRLLAVIDAAQRDPDPVGALARGLAGLEGDLRVAGPALQGLLLQLGLQSEQLAADRAAAGLPPGPPTPPIARQLALSLTGITKVGPSIVIDRAGGPLLLPLPGAGGRQARLGERIAFSAQRGPDGEPVIGPAPVFEVEDGQERLKTYSDHGWIAGLEVVNADGEVSRAIRSVGLRERRGQRVLELAVDAYGNRELFVRTQVTVGPIDRPRGPIPRGPSLAERARARVAGLFSSGAPATTSAPSESVGIVGLFRGAFSSSGSTPATTPAPTPAPVKASTPAAASDERRAEVVPDDQLPATSPAERAEVVPAEDAAVAVGPDDDAVAVDGDAARADPLPRPSTRPDADDPRATFLDPDAPDERDAVAVEDDAEAEPSARPSGAEQDRGQREVEPIRPAGPVRGAPRDDAAPAPGGQGGRDAAPPGAGRGRGATPPAGRPDPLASLLQPLLQGLPGGGGAKGSGGARGAASGEDPRLVATRAAVRALLRRALAQPRARRVDALLDGLDPLVASRPPAHEPLIRQAVARAVLDRRFAR